MKKVVITGGLGYIGMELCKVYSGVSRNYEIKVIERKKNNTLSFRVIAVTSGSITEPSEACSLLLKRKFSCFVVNSE